MKKIRCAGVLAVSVLTCSVLLAGCSSSDSGIDPNTVVGTKLYNSNGYDKGTVVESEENHTFENGATEPGVKMDFGTDENGQSRGQYWLPQRSADTLSTSR